MSLWEFLSRDSDVPLSRILGIAAVSGLANALLLMLINSAANEAPQESGPSTQSMVLFLIAIVLYVVTQRYILRMSTTEVEKIVQRVRVNLADKIRTADLYAIESFGRSEIFGSLNMHTMTLSQTTAPMILACQGALLVLFSAIYIFILSPTAFYMTAAIVAAGVFMHFRQKQQVKLEMERSTAKENELFSAFTNLLDGFKEVKLSSSRSDDLYEELKAIAVDAADLKTKSAIRYADLHIFTQVLFYMLLGAIVFILPGISAVYSTQVRSISASILFIIGPLSLIVGVFPMFRRANHAVAQIIELESHLDRAQPKERERSKAPAVPGTFKEITLDGVTFSYSDRDNRQTFTLAPVNLTIRQGETLFIVGGNGSGKSTLLKVLTGLYHPSAGTISVDGVPVSVYGHAAYRGLFSAIFSDYHLFDRLYGIPNVDDEEVRKDLVEMELNRKTAWQNGRFVNQDLSTGQRKRLALVVSRLEKKPIQLFDEWAADQDPHFRQHFYKGILAEMKASGKTIIAATHDDRYFDVADRVIKMDEGQVSAISAGHGGEASR